MRLLENIKVVLPRLLHRNRKCPSKVGVSLFQFHCSVRQSHGRIASGTKVSDEHVSQYENNGVVCFRQVFSEDWVDKVREGIGKVRQKPSQYSETLTVGDGIYFNDYLQWRRIDEFQQYVRKSPAANICATLLGLKEITFHHDHVFIKESCNESETPWHQDQSYYPVDGWQACSLWMPVTPVDARSGLKFIRGSHKWNKWFKPRYFETNNEYITKNETKDRQYESIPLIKDDDYEMLSWDLEPGDCLVFHMRSVHGNNNNSSLSAQDRQTLVTRWLGDDATLARRPWIPSPPVLPSDISYGDLIKHSEEYEVIQNTWS